MSTATVTRMQTSSTPNVAANLPALPAPRLPYPQDAATSGVSQTSWRVLTEAIFPTAKTPEAVMLAVSYCKGRNLDVMKKMVHVVSTYVKGKEVETVWPGIAELRATAQRTAQYAGLDQVVFGPTRSKTYTISTKDKFGNWSKKEITLEFPEWAEITIYRLLNGQRIAFPGPRVYWLETFAKNGDVPNDQWLKRPFGQLEKCAEGAALRRAFPEEVGNQHSSDEMEGQSLDNYIETHTVPNRSDLAQSRAAAVDIEDETESFEIIDEVGTVVGSVAADRFVDTIISNIKASSLHAVGKGIVNNNMPTIDMLIAEKRLDLSVKAEIEAAIPAAPQPAPVAPTPPVAPASPQPVAVTSAAPSPEKIELEAIKKAITEVKTVEELKQLQLDKQDFLHRLIELGEGPKRHANDVFAKFDARREVLEAADAISDDPESII